MLSVTLSVLLAARSLVGTPWEVAGGVAEPRAMHRAGLVVDASAVQEDGAGEALARRITASGAALLRRAALAPGGPADPTLVVTVRPLAGEDIGYAAAIDLRRAGALEPQGQVFCSLCTEREFVARVGRELAAHVPRLTARRG